MRLLMPYDAMWHGNAPAVSAPLAFPLGTRRPLVAWQAMAPVSRARTCHMPLARCDGCQMRPQAKYISVYLAWMTMDSERHARKLRLCDTCYMEHVAKYDAPADSNDRLTCPSCGIDTDDDYDAIYGTVFGGGLDRHQLEIPFCSSCSIILREWVAQRGAPLEDRRRADVGPTTHPSGSEVLRSMGIQPRVR